MTQLAKKSLASPGKSQIKSVGDSLESGYHQLTRPFTKIWHFLSLPSLQSKLIVPYTLLTLLLAITGIFIITRLVTSSVRERFLNQLYEANRVAADGIVLQEKKQLENLRLMSFTTGVARSLENRDADKLEDLLLPLAMNGQVDVITLIDIDGKEVLTLGREPTTGQYLRADGKDLLSFPPVIQVLISQVDEKGDKYAGLMATKNGTALFTSAPVRKPTGELSGVLMVGTYLDDLVVDLKTRALADVLLLDKYEKLVATSLPPDDGGYEVLEERIRLQIADKSTPYHRITLYHRGYQVHYAPLVVRGEEIGWLGVVLPDHFVVSTEATSRNSLSLLFTAGTIMILLIGKWLATSISRPILRLKQMAQEVAKGNLTHNIKLKRSDEVGELARSFNVMTQHLKERTDVANRLYEESIRRNQELAEINTRLRQAQMQLVQSEKLAAVGQLTAGIVHDVKNPLAAIQGITDLLRKDRKIPDDARQDISIIHSSAVKATKIVTDLLKFARQAPPEIKSQDLHETIYAALYLNRYIIRKAGVKVHLELQKRPVNAVYDNQQMEQVLINLIQNAVQAMPEGGYLKVGLAQANGTAQIAIQDTGVGIPSQNLNRIFDPFFTTKTDGTGLGLSTSYGIVASHKGDIHVQSQVGKGTCFTILLPINPEYGLQPNGGEKIMGK